MIVLPRTVLAETVLPHDINADLPLQYERSLETPGMVLYQDSHPQASDPVGRYGATAYTCRSETDPVNGACATRAMDLGSRNEPETIMLRFTEQKSHLETDVRLAGIRCFGTGEAGMTDCLKNQLTLNNTHTASGEYTASALKLEFFRNMALSDLFPAGGIWTAHLILDFRDSQQVLLSTYNIRVTLRLTDKNNIQVWLPQFGTANPVLDLNVRPESTGNSRYEGGAVIDLCLYDGFNTNSSSIQVSLSDDVGKKTGTRYFELPGRDDPTASVFYSVMFSFGGESSGRTMTNGENWNVNTAGLAVNRERIQSVGLPDIPAPVLCWPASLRLMLASFPDYKAGAYEGHLTVTFTPDATTM